MDFLEWLQKYGKEMINEMQNVDYDKVDDHFKDSMDYNLFALKKSIETENKTILTASLVDIFDNIANECNRIKNNKKQKQDIIDHAVFIKALNELNVTTDNIKQAHIKADEILCDVLKAYGLSDIAFAYQNVTKWYA